MAAAEQATDVGRKLIAEVGSDGYDLKIESIHSQLECRASIKVHDLNQSISPADLINLLKRHNISEAVDLEQLAIFCAEAARGKQPQDVLLARGEAPVAGADGWFELGVKTAAAETELQEDDAGRVDFKSIQSFSNIEVGQQIGSIHPPQQGTPGKTITGLPIPAREGKTVSLVAGEGVRIDTKGGRLLAEKAGRAVLDNNRVYIAEEFVVSGDVDLSVGHIDFNGFVEIRGDVLDDFNIRASKGIHVSGSIGACQIESDGPISVGNIAGLGRGMVRCHGTLQAQYLNQANIECWGNVLVGYEIRNSTVKSTGAVSVKQGSISSGETLALEGIQAKILGAVSGARTRLTSGIYFPETDRLQFLRTRLKNTVAQVKKLSDTLASLTQKPLESLRPALREAYELRIGILTQRQVNLDLEREEIATELSSFQLQEHPTANPKINASGRIMEGVIISLGETTEKIQQECSGPVSLIEDPKAGGLRFLSLSPLKISADELAEAIHQAELAEQDAANTAENSGVAAQ